MQKRHESRTSDKNRHPSLINDGMSLADTLKAARLTRQLSQAELAMKLGLRQRQISDLERATVDPRLSTIHNVARALDLELMLIPRHLISIVGALQHSGGDTGKRPLYALGDEDAFTDANEQPQPEVGGGRESSSQPDGQSRARIRR